MEHMEKWPKEPKQIEEQWGNMSKSSMKAISNSKTYRFNFQFFLSFLFIFNRETTIFKFDIKCTNEQSMNKIGIRTTILIMRNHKHIFLKQFRSTKIS